MSDQFNDFDQIFRDRLRDQIASPPDSIWNNIQAERSFGHIVANKISSSWRIIGTIILLAMAGGASALLYHETESNQQKAMNTRTPIDPDTKYAMERIPSRAITNYTSAEKSPVPFTVEHFLLSEDPLMASPDNEPERNIYEQSDLFASANYGGFGKPQFDDPRMSALLDEMEGWETAKPASMVHFYHLDPLNKREFDSNKLVKTPLFPSKDFDYVIEATPKKGFRERSSLIFYFGPQFISKTLTPEYNMETEFLEKRLETENTRLAYTAGVNLQYELKNHKFIESGVQLTQIYEEVRIDGEKRFSNQYDFLEVPLLIGYRDRESKWGWEVKGGLGVQVYNNYEGYILKKIGTTVQTVTISDEAVASNLRISGSNAVNGIINNQHTLSTKQNRSEVYDLSSDENPYRKSGVVNVHLAAGVTYFHSINTSFSITPYYRQGVNSLTKESAVFKERITYMGVLFGTRVTF